MGIYFIATFYILHINFLFYLSNIIFKIVRGGIKGGGGQRGGRGMEKREGGRKKSLRKKSKETQRKAGAMESDLSSDPYSKN